MSKKTAIETYIAIKLCSVFSLINSSSLLFFLMMEKLILKQDPATADHLQKNREASVQTAWGAEDRKHLEAQKNCGAVVE